MLSCIITTSTLEKADFVSFFVSFSEFLLYMRRQFVRQLIEVNSSNRRGGVGAFAPPVAMVESFAYVGFSNIGGGGLAVRRAFLSPIPPAPCPGKGCAAPRTPFLNLPGFIYARAPCGYFFGVNPKGYDCAIACGAIVPRDPCAASGFGFGSCLLRTVATAHRFPHSFPPSVQKINSYLTKHGKACIIRSRLYRR